MVPVAPSRAAQLGAARLFELLAAALAIAVLLDQLWWGGFEVLSRHGVLVLAAFVVLARPSSVLRSAVLLTAVVLSVGADLPVVGTHRVLELVVAVTLLAHLAVTAAHLRRAPTPAEVLTGVAPFLRASVVVLYAASALAKVNTTFLDPVTSCAVPSAQGLLSASLLGHPGVAWTVIVGTVAVEASLPALLIWRRTRRVGMVLGLGFHAVLALAGNVPFSALAGALYVAFLPVDLGRRARSSMTGVSSAGVAVAHHRGTFVPARAARCGVVLVLAAGWLVGALVGPSTSAPGLTAPPSALVVPALGDTLRVVTAVLLVGAAVLVLLVGRHPVTPTGTSRPRSPLLVAGVLVLLVNAACPYVGLKTDTSFEMFSGLRTEPGTWNHLVVPEAVRVFDLQDGAVQVLAATDPALVARTTGGTRLLPFELDRTLRAAPGSTAVVRIDGDPTTHNVGPLPPGRTVDERLAIVRDLLPSGVPRC